MTESDRRKERGLKPLVVIVGPTASGKSSLGIAIARALQGEVLACDSTQVYRQFDVGTAKVRLQEQHGIPHHLVDLVEPNEVFTAGEYRRRALIVLDDLTQRGKLPVITAGTGLYLRALLEGLAEAPTRSERLRERLRRRAEVRGPVYLHQLLARLDPEAAARIAAPDTQKTIRALELRILTGKSVGAIHRSGRIPLEGYRVVKVGLLPPRVALYARIDARVEGMIADGWLDEVRKLVARGVSFEAKPFQFIGYSQLLEYVSGKGSLETAIKQIQQATRNFAKRQITWFRKERDVNWLPLFGHDPEAAATAIRLIESHA